MSSSPSRPTLSPSLARGTVEILSTIRALVSRSPFVSSGIIGSRNSGAPVGSVVNAHTVTDAVASNRSSWTMTIGRGFPTYPLPAAAQRARVRIDEVIETAGWAVQDYKAVNLYASTGLTYDEKALDKKVVKPRI